MLDGIESKAVHNDKEGDQEWKKSKTPSKVKLLESICRNPRIRMQKEVLLSDKLQDHVHE